jgi:hypothetical protein
MKVRDLMKILQGCNPDSDVVVEDERTKELMSVSDLYSQMKIVAETFLISLVLLIR